MTMVIGSPLSRVVPLPNGCAWLLNGGVILTTYWLGWSSRHLPNFPRKWGRWHPQMWVFPKIVVPQIIHFNRVFHHPFWGTLIFGNIHMIIYLTNFFKHFPLKITRHSECSFISPNFRSFWKKPHAVILRHWSLFWINLEHAKKTAAPPPHQLHQFVP